MGLLEVDIQFAWEEVRRSTLSTTAWPDEARGRATRGYLGASPPRLSRRGGGCVVSQSDLPQTQAPVGRVARL